MNLQILSADIVRRVQGSPDSAHNLAQVVSQLIREEMNREVPWEPFHGYATVKKKRGDSGRDDYWE